jgi:NtrC-family two-component system response regulator AlgB
MAESSSTARTSSHGGPAGNAIRVLVVDDEPAVREVISLCLEPDGHEITTIAGAEHARVAAARKRFDLALVDVRLGDASGLDLLPDLLEADPSLLVVMITAFASIASAVEAMRRGAFDYLSKPISAAELEILVRRVIERRRLQSRVWALEEDAKAARLNPLLETSHPGMARALAVARDVAATDATVLLTGESGTGKGVVALAIHGWSARADRIFATVNCPSLSAELLRSELFGHVKGSFTGATDNRIGKIEYAHGGTLLLDEVGELDADIQPRMLRFLQDREYERVGDPAPRQADVRLIAATNRDLAQAVADGDFREDLYYRLNVIQIEMVPLRHRPDDIVPLAELFLRYFARRHGRQLEGFTDDALAALRAHTWPGNVRELQNAVERAVVLERQSRVRLGALPRSGPDGPLDRAGLIETGDLPTLEGMEKRYISHVLEVTDSVERAAEVLGVAPSTLWRRRRKFGL